MDRTKGGLSLPQFPLVHSRTSAGEAKGEYIFCGRLRIGDHHHKSIEFFVVIVVFPLWDQFCGLLPSVTLSSPLPVHHHPSDSANRIHPGDEWLFWFFSLIAEGISHHSSPLHARWGRYLISTS
jgi:hypothetical protein